jgi:prophage DNA circulation protein
MSWRDRYRQASFRGVEFFVESADSTHGRRQAVHEFPDRDVPYTEDLGRKAREWTLDGYLIGDDYDLVRNQLQSACETPGPGQLVHPYRGELTVECAGLTISEKSQDGRMCRVSMVFREAGEQSFPRSVTDSVNAISRAGNSVIGAAQGGFIERFLTDGFPAFVREAAAARVQQLTSFLENPGYPFGADIQAASDFVYSVRDLAADAMDLVLEPSRLVGRITSVLGSIRGVFGDNSASVLGGMYQEFDDTYIGSTGTPSRRQQGENFEAVGEFVRQVAISEGAKAAVVTEYPSYQEAVTARDTLLDAIDEESERTTNDDAYVAINGLRTEVVRGIPDQAERLPQLLDYTPRATLPGLLVAYQLYGDASREAEITARNRPRHPGFMIGGQALEVLSDG